MLKNIDPSDKSIKPFKTFKSFLLTNNDSGSGHVVLKAVSGSIYNFQTGSAASQSFGNYMTGAFEYGTYYDIPNYFMIKQMYYENDEPFRSFGKNNPQKEKRLLNGSARVFSIPQELFGEEIKPGSIKLDVTTGGQTFKIRDDEDGNLYDFGNFSSSFAAYKSSSFDYDKTNTKGSGSQVGNAIYQHGLLIITDTGSLVNAGTDGGGHELRYKSTQTHYEYEYIVRAEPNEFNLTANKSVTSGLSGSLTLAEGTVSMSNFLPPGDQPDKNGIGTFLSSYNATDTAQNFVTHSEFRPYVTTVGLYNDKGELLVIGKLGKPIKLTTNAQNAIVVRFDV
tara:strand:- start:4454 stop:5461 length:1008 start_codon:yes stop_codon:yes gene_type:complete